MSELHVRSARGRYARGVLRPENVEAQVQEVGRLYRIRLDDAAHPEAWLELIVEVNTEAEPCAKNGFSLSPSA